MSDTGGAVGAPRASRSVFLGIFLITLSTLVLQITLTRVFSAVLWYHFAFLAISVALFGSGAAGQWVYLSKRPYDAGSIRKRLQLAGLLFSLSVPISFLAFVEQDALTGWLAPPGLQEIGRWALTYVVFAIPFFFAGTCVALALAAYRDDVSRLYFFDLFGAGLGCLVVVPLLSWLGGPGTVQVVAVLAALATTGFALGGSSVRTSVAAVATLLMALLVPSFARLDIPILIEAKTKELPKVAERWNAFSRVAVHKASHGHPMLWGLGSNVTDLPNVEHRNISIDAYAGTPMIRFDGDFGKLDFLKADISAIAYYVFEPGGSAVVIGAGGGRDVITALKFGAGHVYAVEINPLVIGYAMNEFGGFTGHIYEDPRIDVVVDEGRSYIAKLDERVDLIQASMVDTAAASAAGAFSLTENNLYTVEAFEQYYDHLTDGGIVTLTRAYPSEALRLLGIARTAWSRRGVEDAAKHVIIVNSGGAGWFPLANVMVKRTPFTNEEIETIEQRAEEIGFGVAYKPGGGHDDRFTELAAAPDLWEFARHFPIDISPNTDDSPFFFNFVRIRDVLFSGGAYHPLSVADNATIVLLRILGIVAVLALVFILGPLLLRGRLPVAARATAPYLAYFTGLGFAFILVEIPLVHRFILFLGHPVYALTVVLFSLLIFSGLGSLSTQRIAAGAEEGALVRALVLVLAVLAPTALVLPPLLREFVWAPTPVKMLASPR
jgi:spermidine synthase